MGSHKRAGLRVSALLAMHDSDIKNMWSVARERLIGAETREHTAIELEDASEAEARPRGCSWTNRIGRYHLNHLIRLRESRSGRGRHRFKNLWNYVEQATKKQEQRGRAMRSLALLACLRCPKTYHPNMEAGRIGRRASADGVIVAARGRHLTLFFFLTCLNTNR